MLSRMSHWKFVSFGSISVFVAFLTLTSAIVLAQNTETKVPPVIDVHVHAMDGSFPGGGPMCPNTAKFTASDPKTKEAPFGWVQEDCTPKLYPSAKGEYMKDVLAEMERLNVTAVVFGDPKSVQKWKDAAPERVIPGTAFERGMQPGTRVPLEELRKDFTTGGFKVMGEIGLQYEGFSPSDPSVDKYFALAEELDIPVAIHMGTGGSGRANITIAEISRVDGESAAARGSAGAASETARAGDACRLSDDRQYADAAAGELARVCRCRWTDLELSAERSQPLHRAPRRWWISKIV